MEIKSKRYVDNKNKGLHPAVWIVRSHDSEKEMDMGCASKIGPLDIS